VKKISSLRYRATTCRSSAGTNTIRSRRRCRCISPCLVYRFSEEFVDDGFDMEQQRIAKL